MSQTKPFTADLSDRITACKDLVILTQERKLAELGFSLTDSDVLDAIDSWTTGQCEQGCPIPDDNCCDYSMLSTAVWAWIDDQLED